MRSSDRIRKALNRYQRKPIKQQGILGNEVGVISVPNRVDYVYVRIAGLGTIAVYNKRVPLILDLPVDVGYDPLEPKNFQVLNIHRYPQGGGRGLVDVSTILHGKTHNWAGIDPVFLEKRQLMPLRPTPIGGMGLYVTREVAYYDDRSVSVTGQQFDLTPYVPATGSLMVLIYKDVDEIVKIQTGGVLKDIFSLTIADAPQAYPGTVPIALVRLYGGQTGIAEGISDTDLVDIRPLFSPTPLTGTVDSNAIHVNVANEISTLTDKASPVDADLLIIEDSADSGAKKKIQIGNLPGGAGGAPTDAKYVTTAADGALSAEIVIPGLAGSPDVIGVGGTGTSHEYDAGDSEPTWTGSTPAVHVINTDVPSHYHIQMQSNTETFGLYSWTPGANVAFDIRMKLSLDHNSNAPAVALMVANSDNSIRFLAQLQSGAIYAYSYSGGYASLGTLPYYTYVTYLRITRDSSNNYTFYFSYDGHGWLTFATANNATAIAKIGFRIAMTNANANNIYIDWLRSSV